MRSDGLAEPTSQWMVVLYPWPAGFLSSSMVSSRQNLDLDIQ